jgi:hypothetical protein
MKMINSYILNLKVSNRDLLRKYKTLKSKLIDGEVEEIIIPQKGGEVIKMTVEREKTPMQNFLAMIEEHGPIYIDPVDPEFFDLP